MIAWSIAAAQDCGFFDHIMVSTDDDEIADMALKSGAEVPFIRPSELADDFASTTPVVAHAVHGILIRPTYCGSVLFVCYRAICCQLILKGQFAYASSC